MRPMTVALVLTVPALAFAAGRATAREGGKRTRQAAPHVTQLDGAYWKSLAPDARQVYLTGFITGAAAEEIRAAAVAAGRANDSAAVSAAAIAAWRRERGLNFRFAPSVYSAQMDDFYWWSNHNTTPIVDVLVRTNVDMLKQQPASRP
jgi:hypothetical protein